MRNEKKFLWILFLGSLFAYPFTIIRKSPIKDWIIVFSLVGLISGIIDKILTEKGFLKYPTTILKNLGISGTFDFMLCPLMNVIFNQFTYKDRPIYIFLKVLLFTTPMSLFEKWLEKNTSLIRWRNGWSWYHTFFSITLKYLAIRSIMGFIRYLSKVQTKLIGRDKDYHASEAGREK